MIQREAFTPGDLKLMGIQPKLVHHGCVDIRDVVRVLDRVEAQRIRGAVLHTTLYPTACQPRSAARFCTRS